MSTTQTTSPACSCLSVRHALTLAARARVVTAQQVAVDQGDTDRVAYLGQQLEHCTTSGHLRVEPQPQKPRVKPIRRGAWHFGGAR